LATVRLNLHPVKQETLASNRLLDNDAVELVRRFLVLPHNPDCMPRPVPRRQMLATGVASEGAQFGFAFRLEQEHAHYVFFPFCQK
jgi:hypothetical protein